MAPRDRPARCLRCKFDALERYCIGACVGRGSVVGVGVGTGGDVEGVGDGITVFTDGPALLVSPTRDKSLV
jgi:hypothetical protein